MIIETAIVNLLRDPLGPTYYGTAPQPEGDEPVPLPVIVVNRMSSRWPAGFCGTDPALSIPTLQIDYYAETAQEARQLADQGRDLIAGMADPDDQRAVGAILENEFSSRDDVSRAWRVLQQWTIPDYSPSV